MGLLLLVGTIAFLLATLLTPMVRGTARRFGIVDKPDQLRKMQSNAIALGGGIAVLVSFIITCGIALATAPEAAVYVRNNWHVIFAITASFVAISLIGFADDAWTIRGRQKLAAQVLIGLFLCYSGLQIHEVSFFGYQIHLGWMAIPVTLLWLAGTSNALNLIDGSDGLCSTVGVIVCGAISIMALWGGHQAEALMAAALAGALAGFLIFNFPPASIYLGDSGSLLIGLAVGVLSIRASLKGPTSVTMLAPLALLAIPLFDSSMAILRRKLTGRSIYAVDRAHLHHNLLKSGLSTKGLLLVISLLSVLTAAGAVLSVTMEQEVFAIASAAIVIGILVISRIFGYVELKLLGRRCINVGRSLITRRGGLSGNQVHEHSIQLQGSRSWDIIWQTLTEFAEKHGLCKVCLDLNVPWMQEGFHASWYRAKMPDANERWQTKIPIVSSTKVVGRLEIAAPLGGEPAYRLMSLAAEMMESLENHVQRVIDDRSTPIPPPSDNTDLNIPLSDSSYDLIPVGGSSSIT
jgi:UDP-GlcNAc:undecaprenyl-phosphate/decaprenyl-phosphate GlcNAc-1-phosphate transferase